MKLRKKLRTKLKNPQTPSGLGADQSKKKLMDL